MRSSLLLLVALAVCLAWLPCTSAHITMAVNTGVAGASLATAFRVPHGCDVGSGGDSAPKIPTLGLTVWIPASFSAYSPLPGYVPSWPLVVNTSASNVDPLSQTAAATTYTWMAADGVGLPLGQFLTFPFSLTLPGAVTAGNNTLRIAALQICNGLANLVSSPTQPHSKRLRCRQLL